MSTNVTNQVSFLRTSRSFPEQAQPLSVEVNKSYVDIANAVNSREIGLYAVNRPSINGQAWFVNNNQKQQGLRQVYNISGPGSYPHGINTSTIYGFSATYGEFTDGSNWYPLPYVDEVSATNQISLKVSASSIIITPGGGTPPTISRGFVILEWISLP